MAQSLTRNLRPLMGQRIKVERPNWVSVSKHSEARMTRGRCFLSLGHRHKMPLTNPAPPYSPSSLQHLLRTLWKTFLEMQTLTHMGSGDDTHRNIVEMFSLLMEQRPAGAASELMTCSGDSSPRVRGRETYFPGTSHLCRGAREEEP